MPPTEPETRTPLLLPANLEKIDAHKRPVAMLTHPPALPPTEEASSVVKRIPLTRGAFALVDDEDYGWLSQMNWHCTERGYAARRVASPTMRARTQKMHRLIMGLDGGNPSLQVDHINGNKLDNRRENLRVCTHAENNQNRGQRGGRSRYKGIVFFHKEQDWGARIRKNGKRIYLGRFKTEEDAARAYDMAARKHHGAFAYVNFPRRGERGLFGAPDG